MGKVTNTSIMGQIWVSYTVDWIKVAIFIYLTVKILHHSTLILAVSITGTYQTGWKIPSVHKDFTYPEQ